MPEAQGPAINLDDYMKHKAAGSVNIVKINGQPYYSKRGFDPETGVATPVNVPLQREGLVKFIEGLKVSLASAESVLADMEAAPEAIKS